mgnify:CR=1 FL=1
MEGVRKFYRHSSDKADIGWSNCMDRHTIGPILQQTFEAVGYDRSERKSTFVQEGGWSEDPYVIHRRLFEFQNEVGRFMGDSGAEGDNKTQVYEVIMNSTSGWAQYLSVIGGQLHEETLKKLEALDFAPKHSYLANNDPVPRTSGRPSNLWLNEFICIPEITLVASE